MNVRVIAAAMLSLTVGACGASDGDSSEANFALNVSDSSTAGDVGLPAYPGSKPYEDGDDDSNAADIGISLPWFGLKVVAVELETTDEPEKVAAFYRKALSKYGEVLECLDTSEGQNDRKASQAERDSEALTCKPDDPGSHSIVYKVGTENNQRIVAIKPHRGGTQFNLVHVNIRDED